MGGSNVLVKKLVPKITTDQGTDKQLLKQNYAVTVSELVERFVSRKNCLLEITGFS